MSQTIKLEITVQLLGKDHLIDPMSTVFNGLEIVLAQAIQKYENLDHTYWPLVTVVQGETPGTSQNEFIDVSSTQDTNHTPKIAPEADSGARFPVFMKPSDMLMGVTYGK